MGSFFIVLVALFVAEFSSARVIQGPDGITINTCEDILAGPICTQLRDAAQRLNDKVDLVDDAVREIVAKGEREAEVIAEHVRTVLVEASELTCEDVLAEKLCTTIRNFGDLIKVKVEDVEESIKMAIARGEQEARDIYETAIAILKEPMTCDRVLGSERCDQLRAAAKVLVGKVEIVDEIIRKVVTDKMEKAEEIILTVRKYLVDMATGFKCTDILAAKVCEKIEKLAEKVHIEISEVETALKEAIAEGITELKEIIKKIKEKLFPSFTYELDIPEDKLKCEDVLAEKVCANLREICRRLKLEEEALEHMIKEAIDKEIKKVEEIEKCVRDALAKLSKLKCEDILAKKICDLLRTAAERLQHDAEIVDDAIRTAIARGHMKAEEIVEHVKDVLVQTSKLTCEDILAEKVCKRIEQLAEALHVEVSKVEAALKEAIAEGITNLKEIIKKIEEKLFPSVSYALDAPEDKHKCEEILSEKVCANLREICRRLKLEEEALEKAIKEAIHKEIKKVEDIEKCVKDILAKLSKLKCEDILAKKICDLLRTVAGRLHDDAEIVDDAIRTAIAKGHMKVEEIVGHVKDVLVQTSTLTCEDILAGKVCEKIEQLAETLHVEFDKVETALKEAVAEGITNLKEIITKIKEKLFPSFYYALDVPEDKFKCEDVLAEKVCANLREICRRLKLKVDEVEKAIKAAIAKEIKKVQEIEKCVADILEKLSKLKCEDILAKKICDLLRTAAGKLKQDVEIVDDAIRTAIARGKVKTKEIVGHVQDVLVQASKLRCEDVLAGKLCNTLRSLAHLIHAKAEDVEIAITRAIIRGMVEAEDIYHTAIAILKEPMTCDRVLGSEKCDALRKAAKILVGKAEMVDELVRKVITDDLKKAEDIVKKVKSTLVNMATAFKCENVLAEKLCARIRAVAEKLEVKFSEVEKVLKELVAEGVTDLKNVINHLKEKLFPSYNLYIIVEDLACEDVLAEKVCTELREAAERLHHDAAIVDQKVRDAINQGIAKAEDMAEQVKTELIKESTLKCNEILGDEKCNQLVEAAKTLLGKAEIVDQLVRMAVYEKLEDAKEIMRHIRQCLVDFATSFKCENILSEVICDKIRGLAEVAHVKAEEVDLALKELVAKGLTKVTDILKKIREKLFPSFTYDEDIDVDISEVCEEILGDTVCNNLREVAEKLQHEADFVDEKVAEVVAKGEAKVEEIEDLVRAALIKESTLRCYQVLGTEICEQLVAAAKKLVGKAEIVDELVRKAVGEKIEDAKRITRQIRQRLVELASALKCEKILSEAICSKIRVIADFIPNGREKVNQLLKELVAKGITKGADVLRKIKEKLFPSFSYDEYLIEDIAPACEEVLAKKVCKELREAAERLHHQVAIVDEKVKAAIAKGIVKAEHIAEVVREELIKESTLKCNEVLGEEKCEQLLEAAKTLLGKAEKVDELVRQAIFDKIEEAKRITRKIEQRLVDMATSFNCEDLLSEEICNKIQKIADFIPEGREMVNQLLKELVAKGITKGEEVLRKIKEKLFPSFSYDEYLIEDIAPVCEEVLAEKVCKELREAAERLHHEVAIVDEKVKAVMAKGIVKAEHIAEVVREELIKESTLKCNEVLGEEKCEQLLEAAKTLLGKAEKVDELVRQAIFDKIEEAKRITREIEQRLVDMATSFSCEDLLSEKICNEIHRLADLAHIKADEVDQTLKEMVAKGITRVTDILKKLREMLRPRVADEEYLW